MKMYAGEGIWALGGGGGNYKYVVYRRPNRKQKFVKEIELIVL